MLFLYIFAFVLIIFLFLVFPSLRRHGDRELMNGKFIAHRGFHQKEKGIPENSLLAFSHAIAMGFAIETDIHLTLDGEIVAFHDNTLKRMCGKEQNIEEMTLAEIKECRLLNTDEQIPTLKELLRLTEGRVPLVIEIKCNNNNYKDVCSKADEILKDYKGKYIIQSFFPMALFWYSKNRPDIFRGLIASVYKDKGFIVKYVSPFLFNFLTRPDFVSYDVTRKKRFMFFLQKLLGAMPFGWTFENEQQLKTSRKDFKAYIFENFNPKEEE